MSERRSRRTRGERPELVPPKSDEEPVLEENFVDDHGNKIAVGAIRGRRRGKRGRSKDDTLGSVTPKGSSSSLSQLVVDTKKPPGSSKKSSSKPPAVVKKRRGRPPKNRSPSPLPSESSVASSVSASESIEEDDDDTMESGANSFDSDASNDSNNADDESDDGGDDAERDTEDDAPKEALTTGKNKKLLPKKQQAKKQQGGQEGAAHPRYKNTVKLECRHCGKLCFSQGIKTHEKHCMPVYTPRPDATKTPAGKTKAKKQQQRRKRLERLGGSSSSSDSRQSSSSSGDSSDTSSPPSPVVIVRKKKSTATTLKKSAAAAVAQPREKGSSSLLVATDPAKPFICRNCGKFFTPRGINAHEKRCMPVYIERASPSPDIQQPKPKESENEEQPDSESKDQEHETSSSVEAESSDIEAPAPKSKLRICEHCGNEVNTRGFHHHERSCIKKQRLKAKKIASSEKKEAKKRKRKISDKGTAGIAATTTYDESLWEDNASSAAKGKGKTANDVTTNAGEGKIAEGKNTKTSKDPSSKLSLTVTPKRKRRKKKSGAKEDDEDVETKDLNDDSSTTGGENLPTKTPKPETAPKKLSDYADQAKWSPDDSLPIASTLGSTAKTKKLFMASNDKGSLPTSNKGESGNGKDKTNLTATQKKKGAKNSKASKATTKGKTTPITDFFAPKTTSTTKQQTKPAASTVVGEGKNSNKRYTGVNSTIVKEAVASTTSTVKQNSIGGTAPTTKATGKKDDEKEGSNNKIGKDEGQKSTENIQDSVSKTAAATKKGGIAVAREDEKVSSTTFTVESNKVGSAAIDDAAKEEPNSSKITREGDDIDEASVTPIDTERSEREDYSTESDGNEYSENPTGEGKIATRKGFEKKEKNQSKAVASTRPTRKRKLTPKAAEAAAIIATKIEEKRADDIESDDADGSDPVLGKKPKIIHDVAESVSDDPPSEGATSNQFTLNTKRATATPLKDQKGKASIVEAAKNAAAATLAAFSIFAAKPKSVEGNEKAEVETKPVESPPVSNTAEKPTATVTIASNNVPMERVHDGDEAPEEEKETPLGDTKKTKPTEAMPTTTTDIRNLKQDDAVSSPEKVAPEALYNEPDPTTHSSTTTDQPTTEERQQPPQILNSVESPTAIHRGAPSEEINATKSIDPIITTAKTESERVEKTHLELDSEEAKSSTATDASVDIQKMETKTTTERSLSLAEDKAQKSENSLEINKPQQNEIAESASDANNYTVPLSKIDSISVRQDNLPVTSDEANEDTHTTGSTDPEKTFSDHHTSNCEENRVEIKENASATEKLTTSTNDSHVRNGIDPLNETHEMESKQSDAIEELVKEVGTGKTGEGKSEEKDLIQSSKQILETENSRSADTGHPKTSVDQPSPKSLIVPKHDIVEKESNKEVQKPKEVPTGDKATHEGSDEVRDATSAAVEKNELIVKDDEEIESDQVADTEQPIVPKEESNVAISSNNLVDDPQDAKDASKEIEKGDTEYTADDSAEAEDGIQGEKLHSKQNVAEKSQSVEEQNGEELSTESQDAIGKPEEAIEENSAQSESQIPSSTDLVESISDSMESEKKSMAIAPENETRMSEDAAPTDRSPDLAKTVYVGQDPSLPADKPSLLQEMTSTSTEAPKAIVISNSADIAVSKVAETNSAEQQPAESGKDSSVNTAQLSDVSKHGSLIDDISAANTLHSETPSQTEKSSKSIEEPTEDTVTLRAETATTQQRLENSIDWKESVSIQTKADIGSKDEASKMFEERSTATPVNAAKYSNINKVATNEGEDKQSEATDEHSDDQETKSNVRNDAQTQEVVSNEKNAEVKASGSITVAEANATITGKAATEFNGEKTDKSGISNTYEIDLQKDGGKTSAENPNQAEDLGHDTSPVGVSGDDSIPSKETGSRCVEKNPPVLNSQDPITSLNSHNGLLQSDSGRQESELKEVDSLSQVENVDGESNKIGEMVKVDSRGEKASTDVHSKTVHSKTVDNNDDPEYDKDEEAKANEQSRELSSGENNTVLPQTESKSYLETPAGDKMNLDAEKHRETSDAVIEGEKVNEGIDLISTEAPRVTYAEESKEQMNLSQGDNEVVPMQSMDLPSDNTKIYVPDAARKDVNAIVESLLNSVESRVNTSSKDVTHVDISAEIDSAASTRMEVDPPDNLDDLKEDSIESAARPLQGTKSKDMQDMEAPIAAISASEGNSVSEEPDSTIDVEDPKEEMKVFWVAMSKASRQSKPAKDTSRFIGYDESKTNRVKMLLYTAGSQVHRGRGFERIFGMYWDAIGLRLSRPLNNNTSKRCDQAMSVFLKSKKLRKIHNKFVMSKFLFHLFHMLCMTFV